MQRLIRPLALSLRAILYAPAALADANARRGDAESLVRACVDLIDKQGADKAYAEINRRAGRFIDRDLYLVAYAMDGTVLAHGANARMVGKNLVEIRDVDGKAFVRERIELARKKSAFWQDYKFVNPATGQIEPKSMYCQPHKDVVICGGIYR